MQINVWRKLSILLPALCLTALPLFAQQQDPQQSTGDSVADAARKAREDKKTAPKAKKVYTDDDVSHPAPPATDANAQGDPGSPDAANASSNQGDQPANENSEAAWRKKFKDQRDKIAKAEKELDILQREEEKAQVQYYPDPQKALTEQYSRKDIDDKATKIEAKKQEIAQLKQGLDDMEEQLRKSGGDPGWARE